MDQFVYNLGHIPEYGWIIIILVIALGFRLIRTLTLHQQKMAQIIQQNNRPALESPNLDAMRQELELLKATVNHQTVMLDNIANQQRELLQAMKTPVLPEQKISL